jgi:hypothetical protein
MQTQNVMTAHSLYVLYETLSDETQQLFLQELLAKQKEKVESKRLLKLMRKTVLRIYAVF